MSASPATCRASPPSGEWKRSAVAIPTDARSRSVYDDAFKTDIELVNRAVRNLTWGNIVFSSPARAHLDESSAVELVLSPSLPIAELEAALRQRASTDRASIRISNRMRALLTADDGLVVTPQSEALQAVSDLAPARWSWRVNAVKEGKQSLHLALYAQILVHGVETGYEVRTFQRVIEVEVTLATRALQFAGANWQWLWTVLLLPGASFVWRLRPQRRREAPLHSGEV